MTDQKSTDLSEADKIKQEKLTQFIAQKQDLFVKWKKDHPTWQFPVYYDQDAQKWFWLNRAQRKLIRWSPHKPSA